MHAYEDAIRSTATRSAPWYVVPVGHKWYSQLLVAAAIIDALDELALEYPRIDAGNEEEPRRARAALLGADGPAASVHEHASPPLETRPLGASGPALIAKR